MAPKPLIETPMSKISKHWYWKSSYCCSFWIIDIKNIEPESLKFHIGPVLICTLPYLYWIMRSNCTAILSSGYFFSASPAGDNDVNRAVSTESMALVPYFKGAVDDKVGTLSQENILNHITPSTASHFAHSLHPYKSKSIFFFDRAILLSNVKKNRIQQRGGICFASLVGFQQL